MSKTQLIEAIRDHNPSASSEFLLNFDEGALSHYLHHLEYRDQPRGPRSEWVRVRETRAVCTRSH